MRDGVMFTLKQLRGVYVKRNGKVYEVDCMSGETHVPGLIESLDNRVWTIEDTDEFKPITGFRKPSELKKG